MTDKEMLELAAKAAGLVIRDSNRWPDTIVRRVTLDDGSFNWVRWNPLDIDSGDALRLAVVCRLTVCTDGDATVSAHEAFRPGTGAFVTQEIGVCADKNSATCRAIVRAAAAIGKAMP